MNELDVIGVIYQDISKYYFNIDVFLENKDDLYYLQSNVLNFYVYEFVRFEIVILVELFRSVLVCFTLDVLFRILSQG